MSSAGQLIPLDKIPERSLPWTRKANELVVTGQLTLDDATELLKGIAALLKEIDQSCDPVIKKAFETHKAAVAQKKVFQAGPKKAQQIVKGKVATYVEEEEKKARQKAALEEAAAREERAKAEVTAKELEDMGDHELADVVREESEVAAATPPVEEKPKSSGLVMGVRWYGEVTNKADLVLAVAEGKVPLAVLDVNQKVLNQQATSLKNELKWPGVRVYSKKQVATRG
jgi:hypothetical protein